MTEAQAIEWMQGEMTESQPQITALGMILQDIKEYGFDAWPKCTIASFKLDLFIL